MKNANKINKQVNNGKQIYTHSYIHISFNMRRTAAEKRLNRSRRVAISTFEEVTRTVIGKSKKLNGCA